MPHTRSLLLATLRQPRRTPVVVAPCPCASVNPSASAAALDAHPPLVEPRVRALELGAAQRERRTHAYELLAARGCEVREALQPGLVQVEGTRNVGRLRHETPEGSR